MSACNNRTSSLDHSVYKSKRKWLRYIFNGFGTSQTFRKRNKSEKCTSTQTEISKSRCNNETGTQYVYLHSKMKNTNKEPSQNVSNKMSNDAKDKETPQSILPDCSREAKFEETLTKVVGDIFREYCHESISNDTETIINVITEQRVKFKDELSTLYNKIYAKDGSDQIVNSCYREILIDDRNVHDTFYESLKVRCKYTRFECDEKKFFIPLDVFRFTEKNEKNFNSNMNIRKDIEKDVFEVSISTLNIDLTSSEYLVLGRRHSGNRTIKNENNGDDFSHVSMLLSDDVASPAMEKADNGGKHLLPHRDQRARMPRRVAKKANLYCSVQRRSGEKFGGKGEESSLILDIEVLGNVHKACIQSDHTFDDLETLDLTDIADSCDLQKEELLLRMVGPEKPRTSKNQNNQNSNVYPSRVTMEKDGDTSLAEDSLYDVELLCDQATSLVGDAYGACDAGAITEGAGNLGDLLSESVSSFDPIRFLVLGNVRTSVEPNFWKHTISSRLKMKIKK